MLPICCVKSSKCTLAAECCSLNPNKFPSRAAFSRDNLSISSSYVALSGSTEPWGWLWLWIGFRRCIFLRRCFWSLTKSSLANSHLSGSIFLNPYNQKCALYTLATVVKSNLITNFLHPKLKSKREANKEVFSNNAQIPYEATRKTMSTTRIKHSTIMIIEIEINRVKQ